MTYNQFCFLSNDYKQWSSHKVTKYAMNKHTLGIINSKTKSSRNHNIKRKKHHSKEKHANSLGYYIRPKETKQLKLKLK